METRKRRSATILDVARRAGVSPSTISRVMNGTAAVAPQTRQRVREAIDALGFSPHPAARQLVMSETHAIGVLLTEISGAFFPPMLRGIEAGAREAGYDLLIYCSQTERAARHIGEHNTDGLIVFPGSVDDSELRRYQNLEFPVVLLHKRPPPGCSFPFVTVENKNGAEMLVSHLIEAHRRRRIVYLQGPESHEDSLWRERGYRDALQKYHLPFDPLLVRQGGFDEQEAAQAIRQMLREGITFDAVFAGDDDAAIGVISALRQAGRNLPGDVSVVGFDDVPSSRFLLPPLTTVRAPIEQVGREAVRILIRSIHKQPCAPELLLPTELVIRQSCGCF